MITITILKYKNNNSDNNKKQYEQIFHFNKKNNINNNNKKYIIFNLTLYKINEYNISCFFFWIILFCLFFIFEKKK